MSCWYADNVAFVRHVLNIFNVSMACFSKAPQRITRKSLSVVHIPATKISLKYWIYLSSILNWGLYGLQVGIGGSDLLSCIIWDSLMPNYPWCWGWICILFLKITWWVLYTLWWFPSVLLTLLPSLVFYVVIYCKFITNLT